MNSSKKSFEKVAILEIYSHHVFVHTLASVCAACGLDVSIYTVPRIEKDLKPLFGKSSGKFEWKVANENESDLGFLKRTKREIEENNDLLFINTIQGKRIIWFYLVKHKIPTIVGAGRISEFFDMKYRLKGFLSIRDMFRNNYTKFLIAKCIPRFDGILVHTDQASAYAENSGYEKPMIQIPFSLFQGRLGLAHERDAKKIRFVVTGSIEQKTRNHLELLKLFEKLWDKGRFDIELTVLSSPKSGYGARVLEIMKSYKQRGFPIKYFESWISEDTYLKEASLADCFISPLKVRYYSCGELTSGIVEVIRQGTPGIYPASYLPDPIIASSSIHYESFEGLAEIIVNIADDKSYRKNLEKEAVKNSQYYSLENVAARFGMDLKRICLQS